MTPDEQDRQIESLLESAAKIEALIENNAKEIQRLNALIKGEPRL